MSQAQENALLTSMDADFAALQATNSALLKQYQTGSAPDDSAIIAHLQQFDNAFQAMQSSEAGQLTPNAPADGTTGTQTTATTGTQTTGTTGDASSQAPASSGS